MYICQIKYVYLSNNCICVTGIHMYIWRARLGEGGEGLEGLGEGGKRRVREDRDQRQVNRICTFAKYVTSIQIGSQIKQKEVYKFICILGERVWERKETCKRNWERDERGERKRAESRERLIVFIYLSYNCVYIYVEFVFVYV